LLVTTRDYAEYYEAEENDREVIKTIAGAILTNESMRNNPDVIDDWLMVLPAQFLNMAEYSKVPDELCEFRIRKRYVMHHMKSLTEEEKRKILMDCKQGILDYEEIDKVQKQELLDDKELIELCRRGLKTWKKSWEEEIQRIRQIEKEEALEKGKELIEKNPEIIKETKVVWKEKGTGTNFAIFCSLLKVNAIPTKELNLGETKIRELGAKMISESLKTNTTLTKLILWTNKIGDEGAKMISESLKINTTLTKLYLSNNKIGDEGTKMISESLRINTTLTKLDLSDNNIGEEGAKMISESLKINTTLTKLDLYRNSIGDEGANDKRIIEN